MAKRFTDSGKYKNKFIRSLQGPYKLLWDYLYHDCTHAGIWTVDFEIAQIYLGKDMPVNHDDALKFFNEGEERIKVLKGGEKWLIVPFLDFQYGKLNPENRVHKSVITELEKYIKIKVLLSPSKGAKDKDKVKDKDKEIEDKFTAFWSETNFPKRPQDTKGEMKKKYTSLVKNDKFSYEDILLASNNFALQHEGDEWAIGMRKFLDKDNIITYLGNSEEDKRNQEQDEEEIKRLLEMESQLGGN